MLENDPPPGTKIMLLSGVTTPRRAIKAYEYGALVKALQPWTGVDLPSDRFLVRILGEEITVRRDQISVAAGAAGV